MTTYTVNVYGIFTLGSASSNNREQRRTRLNDDVNRANEIWRINGENCINFVAAGTFNANHITINASDMLSETALGPNTSTRTLINQVRSRRNGAIGIYIVYLSGDHFADRDNNGNLLNVIGYGGPQLLRYNSPNDYQIIGEIVITDGDFQTNVFAHEAGHNLLTRIITDPNNNNNQIFDNSDPTGPYREFDPITGDVTFESPGHSADPNNIMYPVVTNNTQIATEQCDIARQSTIVIVQN
ncbi:hypothetical protein [Bacillus paranthracis]|uniref:hypothetical protein n=1 Tax=Bacillus paranthracis TaxID=2026186 RepID=UPI0018CCEE36|nr:hypothetical protein [Bacillus paranthracis]MBG9906930.1 hypothetical protein [Bacillus paranthracis]